MPIWGKYTKYEGFFVGLDNGRFNRLDVAVAASDVECATRCHEKEGCTTWTWCQNIEVERFKGCSAPITLAINTTFGDVPPGSCWLSEYKDYDYGRVLRVPTTYGWVGGWLQTASNNSLSKCRHGSGFMRCSA